jgi:hypothetical protein
MTTPCLKKAVIFIGNVSSVADLCDPQNIMEKTSSTNSLLMSHDVADLMSEHASEFVIGLSQNNQFARHIDSSTDQAESISLGEFN